MHFGFYHRKYENDKSHREKNEKHYRVGTAGGDSESFVASGFDYARGPENQYLNIMNYLYGDERHDEQDYVFFPQTESSYMGY